MNDFFKVFLITVLIFTLIIIFCILFYFLIYEFPYFLSSLSPITLNILSFGLSFILLFFAVYIVYKANNENGHTDVKNQKDC